MAKNTRTAKREGDLITSTLTSVFTVDEIRAELERAKQSKQAIENFLKQYDPILKTPSFKEWEEHYRQWERLKFQERVDQGQKEAAIKSTTEELDKLNKKIATMEQLLNEATPPESESWEG